MTILSKPGADLLVICCWCPGWDRDDPINANASHGACQACVDRVLGPEPAKDAK